MKNLSINDLHTVDEIAAELNFSKKLANGIQKYFGDPISLIDLAAIDMKQFLACKGFGRKSWREFQAAMDKVRWLYASVQLIEKTGPTKIVVEIDFSRSFDDIVIKLSEIIKNLRKMDGNQS